MPNILGQKKRVDRRSKRQAAAAARPVLSEAEAREKAIADFVARTLAEEAGSTSSGSKAQKKQQQQRKKKKKASPRKKRKAGPAKGKRSKRPKRNDYSGLSEEEAREKAIADFMARQKVDTLAEETAIILASASPRAASAPTAAIECRGFYSDHVLAADAATASPPAYCGPAASQSYEEWWRGMLNFRNDTVGASFCNETNIYAENRWVSSLFVCPQVQINDKALYDHSSHSWTVDKYLDDLEERYGGIDCVLLWHSYTNLGADPRNQMDLLRVVPGGVEQLQNVSAQFNARGVKTLFPWNPWDRNSSSAGREEADTNFVELLLQAGASGFNLDSGGRSAVPGMPSYKPNATLPFLHPDGSEFVKWGLAQHHAALLDQPEHASGCPAGLIMGGWVGEGGGPTQCVAHPSAKEPFVGTGFPVECAKFMEPRHTSQFVARHDTHRQPALRYAFFNGLGYNTWENVFGSWNGVSRRDSETIRRMYTLFRYFKNTTCSCDWRPFYPIQTTTSSAETTSSAQTTKMQAQASMFGSLNTPAKLGGMKEGGHEEPMVLWTVVNSLDDSPLGGFDISLNVTATASAVKGWRFFDIWQGREIQASQTTLQTLAFEAYLLPVYPTNTREGSGNPMSIGGFSIDKYPVTNEQFGQFLLATGYSPSELIGRRSGSTGGSSTAA
eukprot:g572.t1